MYDSQTECLEDVVEPALGEVVGEDDRYFTLDRFQMTKGHGPEGSLRPNSYGKNINLEFANTRTIQAQDLPYHVCSDVTWKQRGKEKGPVETYVFFHNECEKRRVVQFEFVPEEGVCRLMKKYCSASWESLFGLKGVLVGCLGISTLFAAIHRKDLLQFCASCFHSAAIDRNSDVCTV